jgi:hypothetical protein
MHTRDRQLTLLRAFLAGRSLPVDECSDFQMLPDLHELLVQVLVRSPDPATSPPI